jgi:AcrR family transcriptional regulator
VPEPKLDVPETDDDADNGDGSTPGRRERKRLETRRRLRRAAFDLFEERGFEDVTVTDIADRADVDPSTFFRHFGSKEAVLFSQDRDEREETLAAFAARPEGEPLLVAIREAMRNFAPDNEGERLRVKLAETSQAVRAEMLLRSEALVDDLTRALAQHLGTDPEADPVPYLTASLWIDAARWYRARALATRHHPVSTEEGLAALDALVRSLRPVLDDEL